ncbi:glycosyltransferase [Nitrosopumilus piranensis]|uniref:Glycosyltransferase 2-like domain-containing protein n=1 Tax=Nitrosopumilus piranensis TaxID=1582439 RepID=A0A0C5BT43_9ARCH|nr:glycosyltransferase family A protein [Nitrosopumilus piranensis]AJM91319.1 hypothetical protein NPIRD3C_0095 [Nitrosopumilus piranensis]
MEVTVIVPAKNEEKNIFHSIKSLLDQTIKPLKIIIVLDRCTDNTEKIVDELINKNKGIIKIIKKSTKYPKTIIKAYCIAETINVGLEKAKPFSEFIMIANADSIFSKDYLKECLNIFTNDEKCGMVGFAHYSNISGSGYLIRSSILPNLNNQIKECAAEDTYIQFSVLNLGYSIKNLKKSTVTLLRERGGNSIFERIKYSFSKGYASYTLGYSFGYELVRTIYWILKGNFSSFAIILGFTYALLKKIEKLDIASTDIVKQWQKKRINLELFKKTF